MTSFILSIDDRVLHFFYAIRSDTLVQVLLRLTEMGGEVFVGGIALCLILVFLARKSYSRLTGLLISVGGTAGFVYVLKHLIARARPDVWFRAYPESGYSFPSGHSAMAMALYGFCMYLLWRSRLPTPVRVILVVGLSVLIGTIAFSRIYLEVHYMSDAIGGLLLGGMWVLFGIEATRVLEKWERSGSLISRALFRR